MTLLAEHQEPSLAAKKKRQHGALSWPTSTPKNRVWGFENIPAGRPSVDPQLTQETATGSVQYTYQIASGRAEWLSRDPMGEKLSLNLYGYVRNNPIDQIDPLGLYSLNDAWNDVTNLGNYSASWTLTGGNGVGGSVTVTLNIGSGVTVTADGGLGYGAGTSFYFGPNLNTGCKSSSPWGWDASAAGGGNVGEPFPLGAGVNAHWDTSPGGPDFSSLSNFGNSMAPTNWTPNSVQPGYGWGLGAGASVGYGYTWNLISW